MAKKKRTDAFAAWVDHLEAVRLHVWFSGSPFSFHQGKASREAAEKYRALAHAHFAEYERRRGRQAA